MQKLDISPLINNDVQYRKIVEDVSKSYKCDWNDEVHDSYKAYVEQLEKSSRGLSIIRNQTEALVKEIEQLKTDDYKKTTLSLSREVDRI